MLLGIGFFSGIRFKMTSESLNFKQKILLCLGTVLFCSFGTYKLNHAYKVFKSHQIYDKYENNF